MIKGDIIRCVLILIFGSIGHIIYGQVDNDEDGMDDLWEANHGFDPSDRKDAWRDQDGDQILNLFEYQLSTDPNDATAPQVVNFSPGDGKDRFQDLVASGYDGLVVIRFSEGDYQLDFNQGFYFDGSYTSFGPTDQSIRVMLQGGWNQDFTEYNPFCFETSIEMDRDLLRMATLEGDTTVVIMDGLRVTERPKSTPGSTQFALDVFNYKSWTRFSIYNCSITQCSGGLHFRLDLDAGPAEVFIVNSNISNNEINFEIELPNPKTPTKIHIINSVMTLATDKSKGLMEINYNTIDTVDFNIVSSIIWDEDYEYSTNVFPNKTINLDVLRSDFRGGNASAYASYSNISGFDIDPQFVDTTVAFYVLPDDSPMRDRGLNVGLAYRGTAPDIGVNPHIMRLEDIVVNHIQCQDQFGDIGIDVYYPGPVEYSLDNITFQEDPIFRGLLPGTYLVYARSKSGCDSLKVPVILQPGNIAAQSSILSRYNGCKSDLGTIEISPIGNSADYNYSIDGINFQESPIFNDLMPGDYTITIRDQDDCTYDVDYRLNENVQVVFAAIDITHTSCGQDNGIIALSPAGGIGPKSASINDGPFQSSLVHERLAPGDYKISIRDLLGCTTDTVINIEGSNTLLITEVGVIHTSCGLDNGGLTVSSTSLLEDARYIIAGRAAQSAPTFKDLASHEYVVHLEDRGCVDSARVSINDSEAIEIVLDNVNHTSCNEGNGSVILTQTGDRPAIFTIEDDTSDIGVFDRLRSGSYSASIMDNEDCVDTIEIEVLPSLGVDLEIDNITEASCNSDVGTIGVAGVGNGEIQYNLDRGAFIRTGSFINVPIGGHLIIGRDEAGCEDSIEVKIRKLDAPVIDSLIVIDDLCDSGKGIITVNASDGAGHLEYSLDNITFQKEPVFEDLNRRSYQVFVRDAEGCLDERTIMLDGTPSVMIMDIVTTDINCRNLLGSVSYNIVGGSGLAIASVTDSQNQTRLEDELSDGTYWLQVKDEEGCSDDTTFSISFEDCEVYIPNIFSINGAGDNGQFRITMDPTHQSTIRSLVIMDRWGGVLYSVSQEPIRTFTDWWGGIYNGQRVMPGSYPYHLVMSHQNGREETYTGMITVVY